MDSVDAVAICAQLPLQTTTQNGSLVAIAKSIVRRENWRRKASHFQCRSTHDSQIPLPRRKTSHSMTNLGSLVLLPGLLSQQNYLNDLYGLGNMSSNLPA